MVQGMVGISKSSRDSLSLAGCCPKVAIKYIKNTGPAPGGDRAGTKSSASVLCGHGWHVEGPAKLKWRCPRAAENILLYLVQVMDGVLQVMVQGATSVQVNGARHGGIFQVEQR